MKKLNGTSIIEVIIATALINVAVLSALSLINRSQNQNIYARNLAEANKYSTQVADWIRQERETLGWATLSAKCSGTCTYCLNDIPPSFTDLTEGSCTDTITNTFSRTVTMTKNTDSLLFTINTTWVDKTIKAASLEMELRQW